MIAVTIFSQVVIVGTLVGDADHPVIRWVGVDLAV